MSDPPEIPNTPPPPLSADGELLPVRDDDTPAQRAPGEVVYRGVRFDVRRAVFPPPPEAPQAPSHVRDTAVPRDAVVILPLLEDDTVVLIRNRRLAITRTLWEIPAGTMEDGEDPLQTAHRELVEETGYRAQHMKPVGRFFPTPGFCTERLHAFVATGLTPARQSLDEHERITVHPTPWEQALQMARDGVIEDAKTLATLLHHAQFGR
ncbi:MAG: NUDIX hydrolase [Planctomycetota bacterium]